MLSSLFCAALAACSGASSPEPSACRLAISGGLSYAGSCIVVAAYDAPSDLVLLSVSTPDGGVALSGSLAVAAGNRFAAGNFALAQSSALDESQAAGGSHLSDVVLTGLTTGDEPISTWADAVFLLSINSTGPSSMAAGVQSWIAPAGTLTATLENSYQPGNFIGVSVNFTGAASALPMPAASLANGGAMVSTTGPHIEDGSFPLETEAFSAPGLAVLSIRGGSTADGGGATNLERAFTLELEVPALAATTYTSANFSTADVLYESNESEPYAWHWIPGSPLGDSFSVTIDTVGTSVEADGVTTYAGVHGFFATTLVSAAGANSDGTVTVAGSF